MERKPPIIEFSLQPAGMAQVRVQLRRAGTRWVARAQASGEWIGVGATARQALSAALEPLGRAEAVQMLADLSLLAPSVEVVRAGRAHRSA